MLRFRWGRESPERFAFDLPVELGRAALWDEESGHQTGKLFVRLVVIWRGRIAPVGQVRLEEVRRLFYCRLPSDPRDSWVEIEGHGAVTWLSVVRY